MRVDLQGDRHGGITLLTPDELIEFRSEAQAQAFLFQFQHDPLNMTTLRRSLSEEVGHMYVGNLTDGEVIAALSRCLVRACVGFVRRELPPMMPTEVAGAEPEPPTGDPVNDLVDELVSDLLDMIPDAIIPPEFVRLAILVGDFILSMSEMFSAVMDLLRFVGLPGGLEGMVGDALRMLSLTQGGELRVAAETLGNTLIGLAADGLGVPPASLIGESLKMLAGKQTKSLIDAAGLAGLTLEGMAETGDLPSIASAIAQEFDDITGSSASKVLDLVLDAGSTLDDLMQGELELPQVLSEVMGTYGELMNSQCKQIIGGAIDLGELLLDLCGVGEIDVGAGLDDPNFVDGELNDLENEISEGDVPEVEVLETEAVAEDGSKLLRPFWAVEGANGGVGDKSVTIGREGESIACRVATDGFTGSDVVVFKLFRELPGEAEPEQIKQQIIKVREGIGEQGAAFDWVVPAEISGQDVSARNMRLFFTAAAPGKELELQSETLFIVGEFVFSDARYPKDWEAPPKTPGLVDLRWCATEASVTAGGRPGELTEILPGTPVELALNVRAIEGTPQVEVFMDHDDAWLESITMTVEDGIARGEWTVPEVHQGRDIGGSRTAFYFVAEVSAENLKVKSGLLTAVPRFGLSS